MKTFRTVLLATLLTLTILHNGDGARILGFFPAAGKSHHRIFEPLLRQLATRGHTVTYFTPFPMDSPPSTLQNIVCGNYLPLMMQEHEKLPDFFKGSIPIAMGSFATSLAENIMQDQEFKKLIESDIKFDLILSLYSVFHEAFAPLTHRFDAHYIEVLPSGNLHRSWSLHGNPYDTSYIIDTSVPYTDQMNLKEKIHNTFNSLSHRFIYYHCYMPKLQRITDKYFRYPGWESRPSLDHLIRNASLILVNSHYSLNYPYPQASNFKDIGGINLQLQSKPLPKDLKDFLDGATDGVIYFTLGSHVQVSTVLGDKLGNIFSRVFGSLKQRVLWKWETEFPNLPHNIRISKWFPQQEILAHKNTKLFITHGGFLSLTESVYNGVPMIGIPIMGDQYKNTRHMEHFGYGIPLYLENITAESLSWSINHVLTHPEFAENARKRSAVYTDKPQTAMETATFWTEYVIRHKGAYHLRPAIADMPWYQQAMIDVYAALAVIVLLPLYIFYKCIRCICRCICCRRREGQVGKKKKE